MALYAIADLHLSKGTNKPMDIFGSTWQNYMKKIETGWVDTIRPDDYVIIPGDISWGMYLKETIQDFQFIENLPGKKYISKGNHDYWWETLTKLNNFCTSNNFNSINFLHNNAFEGESFIVYATRGWKLPNDIDFTSEDKKVYKRELIRLELSLESAKSTNKKKIVAMHYPPITEKNQNSEILSILRLYNVDICVYGHLHADSLNCAIEGMYNNIEFHCISADNLNFKPKKIF